jgi:hypothetical protein
LTIVALTNAHPGATCTALGSAAKRTSSAGTARCRVESSVIAEQATNEPSTKITGTSALVAAADDASPRLGSLDVDLARLGLEARLRPLRGPGDATSGLALRWRG